TQGALGTQDHTYADNTPGGYTVTVKVTDKDGGPGTTTFTVNVANVNPTATLSNNGPIDEGGNATITFSTPFDPSSTDSAAGFHYAFSCTNGSLAGATYAGSGSTPSQLCSYADNGTYTVRGRIIDKDDGYSEYTTIVTVNNVAPSVTPPSNQTANEGASTAFNLGSFSDPGVNDNPWAVDVNWGDSSPHTTFTTSTQGALGTQSHTYADNTPGGYTVTVTVADKDGGSDSKSFNIDIHNVAPTVTAPTNQSAFEGTSTSFDLGSFTDPGAAGAPSAIHVDWGDGPSHPTLNHNRP